MSSYFFPNQLFPLRQVSASIQFMHAPFISKTQHGLLNTFHTEKVSFICSNVEVPKCYKSPFIFKIQGSV
jgi:hypothetical protein